MKSLFTEAAELLTEARGGRSDAQRRAIFAKMRGGNSPAAPRRLGSGMSPDEFRAAMQAKEKSSKKTSLSLGKHQAAHKDAFRHMASAGIGELYKTALSKLKPGDRANALRDWGRVPAKDKEALVYNTKKAKTPGLRKLMKAIDAEA